MPSEIDIQRTALVVFKQHGRRAETLRDEGAHRGADTWAQIAALCEEWERADPKPREVN
jgi:hypothetical protein